MTAAIGDTVRLKSGGPLMTVVGADSSVNVACGYFAGDDFHWLNSIAASALTVVEAAQPTQAPMPTAPEVPVAPEPEPVAPEGGV